MGKIKEMRREQRMLPSICRTVSPPSPRTMTLAELSTYSDTEMTLLSLMTLGTTVNCFHILT